MDQEIIYDGSRGRALGFERWANPYYLIENMPAATGETFQDWAAKEHAWRHGWIMEDAIQSYQEPFIST